MSSLNLSQTTTTGMKTGVTDFSFSGKAIDEAGMGKETYWYNSSWSTYLGYYKSEPALKQAVDSLNMWAFGKGYECDARTAVILRRIKGWGEDTFDSIIFNLGRMEDINGDGYAEIIKDEESDILINLKPLNPTNVRHVVDKKGIIIGYDVNSPDSPNEWKRFKPEKIFHTCGGRIANEIHGISKIEACKWLIDAKNEAMSDKRRMLHRSTIRIMEVDSEDTSKFNTIKEQYKEAIKNGELLLVPKGSYGFIDVPPISMAEHSDWIAYLENTFYKQFGVPSVIMGGAQEYTEAGSKVGYMTFEVPYQTKQRWMEQDIRSQLGLTITFNRPASLKEDMQESEAANTSQVGFQPNELTAQMGGVE